MVVVSVMNNLRACGPSQESKLYRSRPCPNECVMVVDRAIRPLGLASKGTSRQVLRVVQRSRLCLPRQRDRRR